MVCIVSLMLGAHAHEGYGNLFVCLFVCLFVTSLLPAYDIYATK